MTVVGLRELRQDASDLVRRVQSGEEFEITVSGRPAARLSSVSRASWVSWDQIADVLDGRADPDWDRDRDLVDQAPTDPWAPRA